MRVDLNTKNLNKTLDHIFLLNLNVTYTIVLHII